MTHVYEGWRRGQYEIADVTIPVPNTKTPLLVKVSTVI